MRMDFNVLWVENQQDLVQNQKSRIDFKVKAEGFRLQVKFVDSVDAAVECLSQDIYSDHIDLILMDFDLGPGKKGDEGLVEVRQLIPYRDVIFYSSQASDLIELVNNRQVQGVFCSTREDLPDTCVGVFESLIKKVVDIDHSRGMVMGTTSDIDHIVMDALLASIEPDNKEAKTKALEQIKSDLSAIRDNFQEAISRIEKIEDLSQLFEHHGIYTSVHRLELLRKILKAVSPELKDRDAHLIKYIHEAIPKRNLLAHVRVEVDGFSRKLRNRKKQEMTSADMRTLRLELLEHYENMDSLLKALQVKALGEAGEQH
ncbi:hypothetical protein [Pseudacidovorax intermedius]|uniref:hypothetical protein n=1 Tax=Pseudacidovorax intermedius TaxID=433924 RepID=UPI00128F184D|nr:hypothetical protein [Pseudacidovorax intermedius]